MSIHNDEANIMFVLPRPKYKIEICNAVNVYY